MIEFDVPTMLFMSIFVLFMTASLVIVASLQLRRDPCLLLWVSIGLFLACIGFSLSALRIVQIWELQVIWLGNVFLISAHACVWSAVRRFSEKKIYWSIFFAGAIIWTILCFSPIFMSKPAIRVLVYSLICVFYMGSAAIGVLYYWKKNFWTIMQLAVIMFVYILIYLYRALYWQTEYQLWTQRADNAITIFSSLLISIGLSFSIMTLVKGREEERYRNASLQD